MTIHIRPIVLLTLSVMLSVFGSPTTTSATLVDQGDGTIIETRNDGSRIIWLQDANYASTSGFDTDCPRTCGDMQLAGAKSFISHLNVTMYLGHDDWRLPAIRPVNGIEYDLTFSLDGSTDNAYNITSLNSELAYLFYVELGNQEGTFSGTGLTNVGPFINVQPAPYWSGNEWVGHPGQAYNFHFGVGLQNPFGDGYFSWPVRDLEPLTTAVPEPSTWLLLGPGFVALAFARRKLVA